MGGATSEQPKRGGWLKFLRARKGATAVEFAMVAAPFFWLMMGLAENGMIFNTQSNLDFAMMETSREIRTGQAQIGNLTRAQLRQRVCNHMASIFGSAADCDLRLHLDVRAFPNFETLAAPDLVANNEVDQNLLQFDPGEPSEVVIVRGLYEYDLVTPFLSAPLANLGPHKRLLTSTALFVNEPYQNPAS